MIALEIDDVDFSFGKTKILENLNVRIQQNSLIGVVGPNGGGKTTLLYLIMGFLEPCKGQIMLLGKNPKEIQSSVGYVPQVNNFDRLFPITAKEVVLMGALSERSSFGKIDPIWDQKALYWLDKLGLLCKKDENFFDLSGGQAQRVLIARALIKEPKILILDEPTSNVDRENEKILFDLLKELKKKTTIFMVSHSLKTLTEEVDGALLVNKSVCLLKPEELCQHYSLGIFHPPVRIKRT